MKILLVNDERMEREGIAYLCRAFDARCAFAQARNGREALEAMAREPFDLVITDIRMPVMDGLAFLSEATRRYPRTQYVIYSAYSDFEYAKEAINLSVVDYLLKPIREEEFFPLLSRMEQAVASRREAERQELLVRAFKGLPPPEWMAGEEDVAGEAMLVYLDRPTLDRMSEPAQALARAHFPGAHLLVQNEQECLIARMDGGEITLPQARAWIADAAKTLGSPAHGMITVGFSSYETLREALMEAKKLMSRGFFVHESGVVTARDAHEQTEDFGLFDSLRLPERADAHGAVEHLMRLFDGEAAVSNLYGKYTLIRQIEQMGRTLRPEQIGEMLAARSLAELRGVLEEAMAQEPRPLTVTEAARAYIHAHYGEDISVETIAQSVFLNGNYLCTLFKKETGKTLVTYLTEYRMEQAMRLLSGTRMKTGEVARTVGYKNASYFNMIFKNYFGKTPTDVRKGEG